ncbi:MAG: hypothetical protein M3Z35_09510 [Nitrospirota bacterium]|nr:hypothetical protein [Nitrospirota bacterium]
MRYMLVAGMTTMAKDHVSAAAKSHHRVKQPCEHQQAQYAFHTNSLPKSLSS